MYWASHENWTHSWRFASLACQPSHHLRRRTQFLCIYYHLHGASFYIFFSLACFLSLVRTCSLFFEGLSSYTFVYEYLFYISSYILYFRHTCQVAYCLLRARPRLFSWAVWHSCRMGARNQEQTRGRIGPQLRLGNLRVGELHFCPLCTALDQASSLSR